MSMLLFFALAFFAFFVRTASAGTLTKPANNLGLIGYWSFDEATGTIAHDFSGRGNAGALTGGPIWTPGKSGTAVLLNGSSDYVNITSIIGEFNVDKGTLSTWIKITPAATLEKEVLNIRADGNNEIEMTDFDGIGGLNFRFKYRTLTINSTDISDDNTWHMVTMTWDTTADQFKAYVDGVQTGSTQTTLGSWAGAITGANLGANTAANGFLPGRLDETRIYNRALSATEIATLYKVGSAKINTSKSVVTSGLVGWWSFDGGDVTDKVYDRSGEGNHGYFYNGATSSAKSIGKVGQALRFDGAQDYIQTQLALNAFSRFSISWWSKTSSNNNPAAQISADSGAGNERFIIQDNNNGPVYANGNVFGDTLGDSIVSDGLWHHYVLTVSDVAGGTWKFYRDNVLLYTTTWTFTPSTYAMQFATHAAGSGGYWPGILDDIRLYNRSLSAQEVATLYQSTNGKVNASQSTLTRGTSLESGLVGYWSFNGADLSDKVYDRSGSAAHGYVYNGATSTLKVIGKQGQALNFVGTSEQYVNIPSSLSLGTSDYTIVGWAYRASTGQHGTFIKIGGVGGGVGIGIGPNDGTGFESTGDYLNVLYENARWILSGQNFGTGWHQFALVINSSGFPAVYYDGVSIYSDTTGTPNAPGSALTQIGGYTSGVATNRFYTGKLDEIRTYNRALSAAEVKQLYLLGK